MNFKGISYYLGLFCFPISILAFINILYSSYFDYFLSINSYVITLVVSFLIGFILLFLSKKSDKKINKQLNAIQKELDEVKDLLKTFNKKKFFHTHK